MKDMSLESELESAVPLCKFVKYDLIHVHVAFS